MNVLVLGYGNPLRGDDGIGWAVVEWLAEKQAVTAVAAHQLLPEHTDHIQQAAHVIFIDATLNGKPGAIQVQALTPDTTGPASSHQMKPAVLLALTKEIHGRCPSAHLITMTGQNFGHQEGLSPLIQESLPKIGELVCRIIPLKRDEQA